MREEAQASLRSQVHHIAQRYHWTEPDVLRLPRWKRVAYVELINEVIERENAERRRK